MKTETIIYAVCLVVGLLCGSCAKESPDGQMVPRPGSDGTGYLTFGIAPDNLLATRAGGQDEGIDQESRINTMRLIFYNDAGIAERVENYEISLYPDADNPTHFLVTYPELGEDPDDIRFGRNNLVPIPPTEEAPAIIFHRNPIELPVKDYHIAVLLNYGALDGSGGTETNMDIGIATAVEGHSQNLLSTPMELYKSWTAGGGSGQEDKYNVLIHEFWKLTGLKTADDDATSTKAAFSLGDFAAADGKDPLNSLYLFMGNADGLVTITGKQLENTTKEAPYALPYPILVDRSVAKVMVFKGNSITGNETDGFVYRTHKVRDIAWVPDILNFRIYPLRIPDKVAPGFPASGDADGNETPETERAYRYARDPNWNHYSLLRDPASAAELTEQFLYIKSDEVESYWPEAGSDPIDVFEKTWYLTNPGNSAERLWYYIPENTMAASEQWEDVTSRILLRCNYIPPASVVLEGKEIAANTSYYAFNGYIFDKEQFYYYLKYPAELPLEIDGIYDIVKDEAVKDQLISIKIEEGELPPPLGKDDDARSSGYPVMRSSDRPPLENPSLPPANLMIVEPKSSRVVNGISFYKNGINYYSIPIRHFEDAESSEFMGYGRYGVVRNNVYGVTIEGFYGPGYPLIPDPEGPDDKASNIGATVKVVDWSQQQLNFYF